MDKPVSISVKTWLIRQMSVRTMMQERIIETVVNHQFDSALAAIDTCESIEFSGFGRLYFNKKKALKKLEKMESQIKEFTRIINDPLTPNTRRKSIEFKLQQSLKNFEYLNTKVYGYNKGVRRVEEPSIPSEEAETIDKQSAQGEDEDMQEV